MSEAIKSGCKYVSMLSSSAGIRRVDCRLLLLWTVVLTEYPRGVVQGPKIVALSISRWMVLKDSPRWFAFERSHLLRH